MRLSIDHTHNTNAIGKAIDCRYADLGRPNRIFTVPSIHANLAKLNALHERVYQQFQPGDRLIYMGNYTGYGLHAKETINALINFRRCLLSISGVMPNDIIYLRGTQEEMWQKLMQIQFAPNPSQIMQWMLDKGLAQTIQSYGLCLYEAQRICHEGIIRLSRWTEKARQSVYGHPAHDIFNAQLKRAAYTSNDAYNAQGANENGPLLFVNAGVDCTKSFEDQQDSFWWGGSHFETMPRQFDKFIKVFRGYDPRHQGFSETQYTATLDNNCGYGGTLLCAQIDVNGSILSAEEF